MWIFVELMPVLNLADLREADCSRSKLKTETLISLKLTLKKSEYVMGDSFNSYILYLLG